jgi:hypothetical protein
VAEALSAESCVQDALSAESCAQIVMFIEEDAYYDEEKHHRVEENARCASYSGHGLLKLLDREASGRVESRDPTSRIAPYEQNVAW